MTFANPWGLVGLLALPTIAIIHLYHRRFPPLLVAGVHLWSTETQVRSPGRRREKLPITATLLLELLAALLLTLVLSQPRLAAAARVPHIIVVLDDSASMMARPKGQVSFRERALATLSHRVDKLDDGSLFTVIVTGTRPVMLAGPMIPWQQVEPLLTNWQPTATQHEFQPAWDLAAQLADETGQIVFLTDQLPAKNIPVPAHMEVVAMGRPLENVAISAARWIFDAAKREGTVFLRIANHGRKEQRITIVGKTGQRELFRQAVVVDAQSEFPIENTVPGGLGEIRITLEAPDDGLATDNHVELVEPKSRIVTIAVGLPAESAARKAVDRVLEALPDLQYGPVESAHLLIDEAFELPPSRAELWWLGIGPYNTAEQVRKASKTIVGPYLIEKRNSLMDGVVLGGVVWGGVQPLDLNITPIISAGKTPLFAQLNNTQTTGFLLNIDLERSNLSESPDWPVLISNIVEQRRDNLPGLRRRNYRLNEEIRFRIPTAEGKDESNSDELMLVHKGGTRKIARMPIVELPLLTETGIYEILDGKESLGRFAVNFHDDVESTLLSLGDGRRSAAKVSDDPGVEVHDNTWVMILGVLLILLVVLGDWFVLRPRSISVSTG